MRYSEKKEKKPMQLLANSEAWHVGIVELSTITYATDVELSVRIYAGH